MSTSPNSKSRKLRNKAIAKAKACADERRKTKNATKSLEEVKKEEKRKNKHFY
jgi:RNase H-fold protein (predicted Holliday junction resolvase)